MRGQTTRDHQANCTASSGSHAVVAGHSERLQQVAGAEADTGERDDTAAAASCQRERRLLWRGSDAADLLRQAVLLLLKGAANISAVPDRLDAGCVAAGLLPGLLDAAADALQRLIGLGGARGRVGGSAGSAAGALSHAAQAEPKSAGMQRSEVELDPDHRQSE